MRTQKKKILSRESEIEKHKRASISGPDVLLQDTTARATTVGIIMVGSIVWAPVVVGAIVVDATSVLSGPRAMLVDDAVPVN